MIKLDFNTGVAIGIVIGYCIWYINTAVKQWSERKRRGKK